MFEVSANSSELRADTIFSEDTHSLKPESLRETAGWTHHPKIHHITFPQLNFRLGASETLNETAWIHHYTALSPKGRSSRVGCSVWSVGIQAGGTHLAGCSHGGATRTARAPALRSRRPPALFSVPKNPGFRSAIAITTCSLTPTSASASFPCDFLRCNV